MLFRNLLLRKRKQFLNLYLYFIKYLERTLFKHSKRNLVFTHRKIDWFEILQQNFPKTFDSRQCCNIWFTVQFLLFSCFATKGFLKLHVQLFSFSFGNLSCTLEKTSSAFNSIENGEHWSIESKYSRIYTNVLVKTFCTGVLFRKKNSFLYFWNFYSCRIFSIKPRLWNIDIDTPPNSNFENFLEYLSI